MNRRNFLRGLGVLAAAPVIAPLIPDPFNGIDNIASVVRSTDYMVFSDPGGLKMQYWLPVEVLTKPSLHTPTLSEFLDLKTK